MRLLQLMLLGICLLVPQALAEEHHHNYIGNHGMVLFAADDILLGSYLPLNQPPYDYQLIYQLTLPPKAQTAVLTFLQAGRQLTLIPEQLNLNRLIAGDSFTANGTIFYDHFAHAGRVWYEDIAVRFARLLYQRPINQPGDITESRYDVLRVNQSYFLIHQIAANAGYDQILRTDQAPPEPLILKAPADVTALQQLNAMGIQATEVYLQMAERN
ncbi:hypothetical protein [Arsukibacterium sp.]|uniref:hypothetical protein n=1 Tax=Arsukibacterium sp. TaxID=1977258 RepID=UPI00299E5B49|nr:hypothetical protein [Arsukibacterium sp.]MDX1538380.1 hypothetical protein [Arsukibacterium sp.]